MLKTEYRFFQDNPLLIEYDEKMGAIKYPDGFFEKLKGLSIEEQKQFFRLSRSDRWIHTGWSERETTCLMELDQHWRVKGIIIKDGYIAGVLVNDSWGKLRPLLPEKGFMVSYESENNGAGYKESIEYAYLLCVDAFFVEDDANTAI